MDRKTKFLISLGTDALIVSAGIAVANNAIKQSESTANGELQSVREFDNLLESHSRSTNDLYSTKEKGSGSEKIKFPSSGAVALRSAIEDGTIRNGDIIYFARAFGSNDFYNTFTQHSAALKVNEQSVTIIETLLDLGVSSEEFNINLDSDLAHLWQRLSDDEAKIIRPRKLTRYGVWWKFWQWEWNDISSDAASQAVQKMERVVGKGYNWSLFSGSTAKLHCSQLILYGYSDFVNLDGIFDVNDLGIDVLLYVAAIKFGVIGILIKVFVDLYVITPSEIYFSSKTRSIYNV